MKSGSSAPIHSIGAGRALLARPLVQPEIAALGHVHFGLGAPRHQHALHASTSALHRTVHGALERNPLATAQSFVGGHHHLAARVHDAVAERLGAENPAKTTECTAPIRAQASIV